MAQITRARWSTLPLRLRLLSSSKLAGEVGAVPFGYQSNMTDRAPFLLCSSNDFLCLAFILSRCVVQWSGGMVVDKMLVDFLSLSINAFRRFFCSRRDPTSTLTSKCAAIICSFEACPSDPPRPTSVDRSPPGFSTCRQVRVSGSAIHGRSPPQDHFSSSVLHQMESVYDPPLAVLLRNETSCIILASPSKRRLESIRHQRPPRGVGSGISTISWAQVVCWI
jgi:hypothetical protein